MVRAILNKSWRQHPTRHQLYGHLPPITKTIQVRRTRHAGHCWRSRDELIRDVLLWTPTHDRAKAGRPARTYIQQLCEDTGCCPEDLPRAMNHREEWRERVSDIRATSATCWWWWWCIMRVIVSFVGCWEILRFIYFSFSSYPIQLSSFVRGSCKRNKDRRKGRSFLFYSNFILRFTTILWCRAFSWTSRNSRVS